MKTYTAKTLEEAIELVANEKGCSKEDYDDFFRATGYIENTQETGIVTSVLPVCDSDECCKNNVIFTQPFTV